LQFASEFELEKGLAMFGGEFAPGRRADVNVIDLAACECARSPDRRPRECDGKLSVTGPIDPKES